MMGFATRAQSVLGPGDQIHYFTLYSYTSPKNDFTSISGTLSTPTAYLCNIETGAKYPNIPKCQFAAYWIYIYFHTGESKCYVSDTGKNVCNDVQFLQTGVHVEHRVYNMPLTDIYGPKFKTSTDRAGVTYDCYGNPNSFVCLPVIPPKTLTFQTYCGVLGGTCGDQREGTIAISPLSVHSYALNYNDGWDVVIDGQTVVHYPWRYKAFEVGIALETTCVTTAYCKPTTMYATHLAANLKVTQEPTGFFDNYGGGTTGFVSVDSVRNTFTAFQDEGNVNGGQIVCENNLVLLGGEFSKPEPRNCFNPSGYFAQGYPSAASSPSTTTKTITTSSTTSVITNTQYSNPSVVTITTTATPSEISTSTALTPTTEIRTSTVISNSCELCGASDSSLRSQTPSIFLIGLLLFISGGASFLLKRRHH